uniref:Conoporin n=1 Tax=Conus ermineus TaxID=55423 RepID=A0A346CII3_CONER|nr:conoporin [Conus ermineus]
MGVPFPALKTMVTVFLLLMGNMSPVVLQSSTPLSMVKAFAYEVVTPGSSLACNTVQDLVDTHHKVTVVIQVENWTRYRMMVPRLRIANDGASITNPVAILPGKREAFAVRMPSSGRKGVYGTVSWELIKANRRFVLMWSAPYDFNHHSNWLGLGMTGEGLVDVAAGNTWFDQMYYNSSNASLKFVRKKFYYNVDPFIYSNEKFEAEGEMTNGHKVWVRVIVRPSSNNWEDLAYVIRQKLD